MTGFATGVQRWCSCLDCVLKHGLGFCLLGVLSVCIGTCPIRIRYGSSAVGLRLTRRQRFRSADVTESRDDLFGQGCSLERKQETDVISEYRHAKLSHSCLARELSI